MLRSFSVQRKISSGQARTISKVSNITQVKRIKLFLRHPKLISTLANKRDRRRSTAGRATAGEVAARIRGKGRARGDIRFTRALPATPTSTKILRMRTLARKKKSHSAHSTPTLTTD